jgi:hypothetical protein
VAVKAPPGRIRPLVSALELLESGGPARLLGLRERETGISIVAIRCGLRILQRPTSRKREATIPLPASCPEWGLMRKYEVLLLRERGFAQAHRPSGLAIERRYDQKLQCSILLSIYWPPFAAGALFS